MFLYFSDIVIENLFHVPILKVEIWFGGLPGQTLQRRRPNSACKSSLPSNVAKQAIGIHWRTSQLFACQTPNLRQKNNSPNLLPQSLVTPNQSHQTRLRYDTNGDGTLTEEEVTPLFLRFGMTRGRKFGEVDRSQDF